MENLLKSSGFIVQGAYDPYLRNGVLSSVRPVYTMTATVMSADLSKSVGEFYIEFDATRVDREYQDYARYIKGFILILTSSGDVVFDSSGRYYGGVYPYFEILLSGVSEGNLEKASVINLTRPDELDVIVAGIIPKDEIDTVSGTIRKTVYLLSLACLLAMLALSYLGSNANSRRVKVVTEAMKKLHRGDLDARIPVEEMDLDEMGEIARSFNLMCEELQNYINKSYKLEIKQKYAQISALQAQINPHFLYNSLEAVRMRALANGDQDTGEMIRLLAMLFRINIKEETVIEVRDELRYCAMYLDLFKIRFCDCLSSSEKVTQEALSCGIVKYLLQPVVENYIVHGFDSDRENNHISISGQLNGEYLELKVWDNGRGISPERLSDLKESLERGSGPEKHIGLPNVSERIRLIYGEAYGLNIESAEGKGTVVTLRLGAYTKKELKRHVQDTDSG